MEPLKLYPRSEAQKTRYRNLAKEANTTISNFLLCKIEDALNNAEPAIDSIDINEMRRENIRLNEDVKFYKDQQKKADKLRDDVIDAYDKVLVDPAISLNLLDLFLSNEKVTTEMLMELKSENISYQLELLELNKFIKNLRRGQYQWKK